MNSQIPIVESSRVIPIQERPLEFMMNAMRLKNGVAQKLLFETTGLLVGQLENGLKKAQEQGLLICENNQLAPSEQGYRFLNELLAYFMPENFPQLKQSDEKKPATQSVINIKELN